MIKRYNLNADAIHNALPLIDTQRTVIDGFCPAYLKRPKCTIKRYREYNGMCNNLDHPHWGATLSSYRRLLPADYADGKKVNVNLIEEKNKKNSSSLKSTPPTPNLKIEHD